MLTASIAFIADVHLGKLARSLRMLGIDTAYRNDYSNKELPVLAQSENRVLLSRNRAFEKLSSLQFFWIETEDPFEQLEKVIEIFGLEKFIQPFTRCMGCNGVLENREKEDLIGSLEKNTSLYYNEFWQCSNCKKIYWEGPHYQRMIKLVKELGIS